MDKDGLPPFQLKLFGNGTVYYKGQQIKFQTRKSIGVLASIAMAPQMSLSREVLATRLWDRSAEEQARASLRQEIAAIKKVLEQYDANILISEPDNLSLKCDQLFIDVQNFEKLIELDNPENLEQAIKLYDNHFLEGISIRSSTFEEWKNIEKERLLDLLKRAYLQLIEFHESNGKIDSAILFAKKLLELNPLEETAIRCLMRLYVSEGRRTEALSTYEKCKNTLKTELDVEPEQATTELANSIKSGTQFDTTTPPKRKNTKPNVEVFQPEDFHTLKRKVLELAGQYPTQLATFLITLISISAILGGLVSFIFMGTGQQTNIMANFTPEELFQICKTKSTSDLNRKSKACKKLITIGHDDNNKLATYYFHLGKALYQNNRHKKAINSFKKAVNLKPGYAAAHHLLGYCYSHIKQYHKAVKSFTNAIAHSPAHVLAHTRRGWAKFMSNDHQGALQDYNKAIALGYNTRGQSLAYGWRAIYHSTKGDYENFLKDKLSSSKWTTRTSDVLSPLYSAAYNQYGIELAFQKRYDEAVKAFQSAINLKTNNPDPYYNLANIYRSKGQYDLAVKNYTKALNLKPQFELAYQAVHLTMMASESYSLNPLQKTKAQPVLIKPAIAQVYIDRAAAYLDKGEYPQAEIDVKKALLLDNENLLAYIVLGNAYLKAGKKEDAVKVWQTALGKPLQTQQQEKQKEIIKNSLALLTKGES